MRTEIFIEDYRLDITKEIATEFSYAIDDIMDFGSRNTSYSKTITIPGTHNNNKLFGFIFDLSNANFTNDLQPNINYNFNASRNANCRIFIDGLQIFKGVLRILEITQFNKEINYECSVFGELGGFINALGNKKLEDLDFSSYDENWSIANITGSWETVSGSGVYYPLIDYGQVSADKVDFQFKAFRPALYVKEYLEKIQQGSGYTWEFPLLDEAIMDRLVIPNNQVKLTKNTSIGLSATAKVKNYTSGGEDIEFDIISGGDFTITGNGSIFTYNSATPFTGAITLNVSGVINTISPSSDFTLELRLNGTPISSVTYPTPGDNFNFNAILSVASVTINQNDVLDVNIIGNFSDMDVEQGIFQIASANPTAVTLNYNDSIAINDTIPKGIFQRDFFLSICKMFNLYVYDDKIDDKKIIVKSYIDFYDGTTVDWSNKVDRSKAWSIKPMSEINARYYSFKYKEDNDYYNENYRKKFNEGYGDYQYDTEFDFVKDEDVQEVIFAATPLFQLQSTDKIYPAIYKKSDNNNKEDAKDSVIRILQAQKITGRTTWDMLDDTTVLGSLTTYGYAGHLRFSPSSSLTPVDDINFGAPFEVYIDVSTYPTTNLFNVYYSGYMDEITDKDSKLLNCEANLTTRDINELDFSKYIYIDGVLFRLNRVDGYNPIDYKTTKVELLKVIDK